MKTRRVLFWAFLILLSVSGVVGTAALFLTEQNVYPGVRLAGLEMGGRSRQQVEWLASGWQKDYRQRKVMLSYGEEKVGISAAELEIELDTGKAAERVWQYGRQGGVFERLGKIVKASLDGKDFWPELRYREDKMDEIIEAWAKRLDKPPKNAYLSILAGGVVDDETGFGVKKAELRKKILAAFSKGEVQEIEIPLEEVRPEVKKEDLVRSGTQHLWGSFVTVFNPNDVNRSMNVLLAAKAIDGVVLKPGGEFSFNQTVGPREIERGFRAAPEIVDGEVVPGVGGGICQVSSTLYNAALLSGLSIKERTNHAKPLSYVAMGRDATVVYGALDFRFINNSDSPLLIRSEIIENKLYVGFFGKAPLAKEFEIISQEREAVAPNTVEKFDQALAPGEVKVEKTGGPGWKIRTLRLIKEGGNIVAREDLGKDFYWPDDKIVKFGPAVQETENEPLKPTESGKAAQPQTASTGRG